LDQPTTHNPQPNISTVQNAQTGKRRPVSQAILITTKGFESKIHFSIHDSTEEKPYAIALNLTRDQTLCHPLAFNVALDRSGEENLGRS